MRRYYRASSLLVSLMIISGLLLLIFLNKEDLLLIDRGKHHLQQDYLNAQLVLLDKMPINEQDECEKLKSSVVNIPLDHYTYRFYCQFSSIFIKPKPTKEKFILVNEISEWLNIDRYREGIYFIHTLAELPPTTEQTPKMVMALQDIDERLTQDFYGIIMTEHYLNFTDKKVYGTIYSTHPSNNSNRRNHSYKRNVIEQLDQQFSSWDYLPSSRNIIANE